MGPGRRAGSGVARRRAAARCSQTRRPRTRNFGRRTGCGAGPCWPTSPRSSRSRAAVEGCAQLHREVTDALITQRDRRRTTPSRWMAWPRPPWRPTRCANRPFCSRCACWRPPGGPRRRLDAGREFRRRLAEETGLDPSPALADLEREIAGGATGPAPTRPETVHRGDDPADRPRGATSPPCSGARRRAPGHDRRPRRGGQDPSWPSRSRGGPATATTLLAGLGLRSGRHPARAGRGAQSRRWSKATCCRPVSPCWAIGLTCW